ncbi:unnamed protein product, partial [Prorocentrum cordatum]
RASRLACRLCRRSPRARAPVSEGRPTAAHTACGTRATPRGLLPASGRPNSREDASGNSPCAQKGSLGWRAQKERRNRNREGPEVLRQGAAAAFAAGLCTTRAEQHLARARAGSTTYRSTAARTQHGALSATDRGEAAREKDGRRRRRPVDRSCGASRGGRQGRRAEAQGSEGSAAPRRWQGGAALRRGAPRPGKGRPLVGGGRPGADGPGLSAPPGPAKFEHLRYSRT